MLGWHWLRNDRRLQFPPHTLVRAGIELTENRPLVMCDVGLHASKRAIDALQYAPGPIVCRVKLGGHIEHEPDKSVASRRTVLWMADATRVLHEFACWCAEQAITRVRIQILDRLQR